MKATQLYVPTSFIKSLIVGFSLALCSQAFATQTIEIATDKQQHLGIKSSPAVTVETYPSRVYSGISMIPLDQAYLISTPLSGLVTELHHFHGTAKKGDVIAYLESPALLTAQKDFLNTLSDFNNAKYNLERAEKLMKTGVVSTKSFQSTKAKYSKAFQIKRQQQQDLALLGMAPNAIEKLIETQRLQPAVLQITAPADGELFDLQIKLGQRISANQAIVSLGTTDPIVIEAPVPIMQTAELFSGQAVKIRNTTFNNLTGKIELIPNTVDPITQTVMVHIEAPNPNHQLTPGQQVRVKFLMNPPNTSGQAIYQAPRNVIAQLNQSPVIFIKKNAQIEAIPIQILNFFEDKLYFTTDKPLAPGSQLIITSTSAVKALFEGDVEGGE